MLWTLEYVGPVSVFYTSQYLNVTPFSFDKHERQQYDKLEQIVIWKMKDRDHEFISLFDVNLIYQELLNEQNRD